MREALRLRGTGGVASGVQGRPSCLLACRLWWPQPCSLPRCPGVPASRAGVPELRGLRPVPSLPGPLLRLVCRRGAVSAGVWGPPPPRGPGGHSPALGPTGTKTEAVPCPCRCSRRAECLRANESGHWLWSREEACVTVTGAQPQNMSRRAPEQVRGQGARCGRGGAAAARAVGTGRRPSVSHSQPGLCAPSLRKGSLCFVGSPRPLCIHGRPVSGAG